MILVITLLPDTMESDNSTSQTRDTFKNLMHQVMQDDK